MKTTYLVDALGRPCKVGDTVLTKGYYSCNMNLVTTITKMTAKSVFITITKPIYGYVPDSNFRNGKRWAFIERREAYMKRDSSSFVVINEQQAHNHAAYPELYI